MILRLFLASTLAAMAATTSAREIDALLNEFNSAVASNNSKRIIGLFTSPGTYQTLPVADGVRQAVPKRLPWDERMPLRITIEKVTYPKPDTAVVNATESDSSPAGETRTWSCVFTLVRVGSSWKISSYVESAPVRKF